MALPMKGWPKQLGRGLRKKGGHLMFLERFNQAWKPLTFETQTQNNCWSRRPAVNEPTYRYRQGLLESSRDPPLTRAAMTRRQIAWIISNNQSDKHSFPCYDMCNTNTGCNDNDDYHDDDVIGVRQRIPYMTAETERTLAAPYLEFGVSVTISGHRFIALTKETSWIDKCKACGKIDAVEFITRCGSQKLCSRQCGQMYVRHRRYRKQIHEKPLFVRPLTCISDRRIVDEEIVLEEKSDPTKSKKKRTYTKRKLTSSSKDSSCDGKDEKPAKRPYKKKSKKSVPKLKVKMLIKKKTKRREPGNDADVDTDSETETCENTLSRDDEDCDVRVKHDHTPEVKSKVRHGSKRDFSSERSGDSTNSHNGDVSIQDVAKQLTHSTSDHKANIKLGHVKIVLTKCGADTNT